MARLLERVGNEFENLSCTSVLVTNPEYLSSIAKVSTMQREIGGHVDFLILQHALHGFLHFIIVGQEPLLRENMALVYVRCLIQ